jgi:Domain of unknown function (DUF6471)
METIRIYFGMPVKKALKRALRKRTKNLLKGELKRKGVTYAQLAEKLGALGISETMSRRNRGDRGTPVALGTALTAIIIIFIIGGLREPANEVIEQKTIQNGDAKNSPGKTVEAVYWGVFTARDTFAQWIAAFAAISSIGVNVWAVWLVRHTLKETRRTARAAIRGNILARTAIKQNELNAPRQMSAYLTVTGGQFSIFDRGLSFDPSLLTKGKLQLDGLSSPPTFVMNGGRVFGPWTHSDPPKPSAVAAT